MGTRTYKSDEFDRFSEREARKREWYRAQIKKKRQAMAILAGLGLGALIVVTVIILLLVKLFSPKDTAEAEKTLSNTPSSEISLVDNSSDDPYVSGTGNGSLSGDASYSSERGIVVIDAGHGGYDSGCISSTKYEKEIDLDIALLLSEKLKAKGFGVYMTRSDDSFIGINDRAELANECDGAVALISIHQNSSDAASDEGVEVWTCSDEKNEQLAQLVVDEVALTTGAINGGVKTLDNLVICSKAEMPAVIVQCGYLSNRRESQNLIDESYQDKIASAIAVAVDTYI